MNKIHFEDLERLLQYIANFYMQVDSENFYFFSKVIVFKIPRSNMKLEMCEYIDEEKNTIQIDCKKSINCKKFFENTDFIVANIMPVARINETAIYMERINPFLNAMLDLSEITYLFETEDGLLEVDSKYCDLVLEILQLFSDEKVEKYVNRKNNYLHIENSIVKAVIAPIKTSEEKRRLFVKKFLL